MNDIQIAAITSTNISRNMTNLLQSLNIAPFSICTKKCEPLFLSQNIVPILLIFHFGHARSMNCNLRLGNWSRKYQLEPFF